MSPSSSANARRGWALGLIAAAQFMVIMDTSIIGVALPEIQRALGFAQGDLSWVFNAYVVAFGGLLLLGGRLSDLLGARRIFIAGWLILTGASLMAGLANGVGVEITGRALQGVGAALIAPSALTLLMMLFSHEPRELTKALALYGAAAPAGGTAGVFLGGVLTEWVDWRWVFFINIPIGLAAVVASGIVLPSVAARRGSIDWEGAATVTGALSLAVFAIVRANEVGWSSLETVALLGAAAALLVVFVAIEAGRREALVRLGVFRTHNLSAANLTIALLGAAWIPLWFFLNLYLQQVLGYGAFEGGAALLPMTVMIMVIMVGVTGAVIGRFGFRAPTVLGLVLLAAGTAWLSFVPADGSFVVNVLPASLVAALGMALAYIPTLNAALMGVRPEEGGLAAGLVNTSYQVGSALGLAAMTAVATSYGADQLADVAALTDGFAAAFVGAAAIAVVGALAAAAWLRNPRAPSAAPERVVEEPVRIAEPV